MVSISHFIGCFWSKKTDFRDNRNWKWNNEFVCRNCHIWKFVTPAACKEIRIEKRCAKPIITMHLSAMHLSNYVTKKLMVLNLRLFDLIDSSVIWLSARIAQTPNVSIRLKANMIKSSTNDEFFFLIRSFPASSENATKVLIIAAAGHWIFLCETFQFGLFCISSIHPTNGMKWQEKTRCLLHWLLVYCSITFLSLLTFFVLRSSRVFRVSAWRLRGWSNKLIIFTSLPVCDDHFH